MQLFRKLKRILVITRDSRWWFFYLQRRFLNPAVRHRIAESIAKLKPKSIKRTENWKAIYTDLAGEGISKLGAILTESECDEIREYFESCDVTDPYSTKKSPFLPLDESKRPGGSHVGYHDSRDVMNAPHLLMVANSPEILDAVEGVLGCKATISYLAAWWSFPTRLGPQQAEHFHRDVDDWRFIKLFVYLTDVGFETGPHVYVAGSAADPALTNAIRRFSDDEVISQFGEESVIRLLGKRGFGVLENTFGIHKGEPVQSGYRLIFQAVYSMSRLPYGPRRPIATADDVGKSTYDAYINRLYIKL